MSASVPSRQLASRCLFCNTLPIRSRVQQRHASFFGGGGKSDGSGKDDSQASPPPPRPNPVLEEYRRRNPQTPQKQQQQPQSPSLQAGDLAASSIFEDDRRTQRQQERDAASAPSTGEEEVKVGGANRDPSNLARVLDPDPNSRERWERKKVIQMIRKSGRLTPKQFVKRTEREHLAKSHNMKTSIKKLGMLARQIQGKTVEEAITQMRFSKKKVAQEVLKQLEFARDEAVVTRGMGLGGVEASTSSSPNDASSLVSGLSSAAAAQGTAKDGTPLQIQLKDGKRHTVADSSTIYVDQAWVGRGPYGQMADYRARGQVNIMRTPWTSLTVLLKEEKTRVREYEEREAKRKKELLGKKVWTHLPDRPVQWQRQWYGW